MIDKIDAASMVAMIIGLGAGASAILGVYKIASMLLAKTFVERADCLACKASHCSKTDELAKAFDRIEREVVETRINVDWIKDAIQGAHSGLHRIPQ